jgi:hypothetical protein
MPPPSPSLIIGLMEGAIRCPVCGDAIGVYESVVVLGEDSLRTSSLAREPRLLDSPEIVLHVACGSASELTQAA